MRVFHEPVSTDLTDMELIELKFIFARREFFCYIPKTIFIELPHQCTMTTETTTFSPTTNLGMVLRSMSKQPYSERNPECVFVLCRQTSIHLNESISLAGCTRS